MKELSVPEGKFIVGLTGNIATGKSAVMKLAMQHGALAIDADKIVHQILAEDTAVQATVIKTFGPAIQEAEGHINRPALGKIVFSDPQALRQLETILHPAVHRQVLSLIESSPSSIIMIEAIKLLEGKLHGICHQIWVTNCSRTRQLERLQICRGLDEETAIMRVDAQAPQENKVHQADIIIETGGLMEDTRRQFELAWSRIPQQE